MFLLRRKKNSKNQNTENGYSNGLVTNMRLMTSFLTHHQRPADYTIERRQRHNGTKNINIIVLLSLKHFFYTAQTKNKRVMTLQCQLNCSAFFLHLFLNHVEHFDVATFSAADRKLDMEWLLDGSFHTWSFLQNGCLKFLFRYLLGVFKGQTSSACAYLAK